jgi:hypothetical protein
MRDDKDEKNDNGEWVYTRYFGFFIFSIALILTVLGIFSIDDERRIMGVAVEGVTIMFAGGMLNLCAFAMVIWTEWPLGE